ncbi:MAG: Gfo/Idh/MocA family oxidoreductase [Bacteroidota bacterium]
MMTILIIGLGSIAKKHIAALKSLDFNLNIYALRSGSEAAEWEDVKSIYSLDDLPSLIDFAIVSNPTNLHGQYIDCLAERKIPLFIEKPPLAELWSSEQLKMKVIDNGIMTYVACNLRFHPCIAFLKQFVSENSDWRVNEVNIYCGSYLPDWRPGLDFKNVYSANAEMGGGVHLDLFHELDYTHWIFGRPASVRCVKSSKSSLNISAVDYANYILNYIDFTANVVLNYFRKDPKRNIEILFENETWNVDLLKNVIFSSTGKTIFSADDDFVVGDTYKAQMEYFIDCLANNQVPMNTFTESLETLKTCLSDE